MPTPFSRKRSCSPRSGAAAKAEPEKFAKLVDDMDRTGRVDGPFKRLVVARKAETIEREPPPLPKGPFRVIVAAISADCVERHA